MCCGGEPKMVIQVSIGEPKAYCEVRRRSLLRKRLAAGKPEAYRYVLWQSHRKYYSFKSIDITRHVTMHCLISCFQSHNLTNEIRQAGSLRSAGKDAGAPNNEVSDYRHRRAHRSR